MKIEYSTVKELAPARAVMIYPREYINYHDTLCLYCADNNIDLDDVDESELESHVRELSRFGLGFDPIDNKPFWFWVE